MPDTVPDSPSSVNTLVLPGLAILDHVDPARAGQATAYVVDGSGPEVLLDLVGLASQVGPLLNGRSHSGFWQLSQTEPKLHAAIAAGRTARDELYQRVGADAASTALLRRLGQVLEALDGNAHLRRTGTTAPDWLQYLLNDALVVALPDDIDQDRQPALVRARRAAWDVRLLRALLEQEGLPAEAAFNVVFERTDARITWAVPAHPHLLAPGALDEAMLARPDEVERAADGLSPVGRLILVERIGAAEALRVRFARLAARLAAGENKPVREAATRCLGMLEEAARLPHLAALLREGRPGERMAAAELLARIQDPAAQGALEAALAQDPHAGVQQAVRLALSRLGAALDAGADLPEPPPAPPPLPETALGMDAVDDLLASRDEVVAEWAGHVAERAAQPDSDHLKKYSREVHAGYAAIDADRLRAAVRALNGDADAAPLLKDNQIVHLLEYHHKLEARPDFGLFQALRMDQTDRWTRERPWFGKRFQAWLGRQDPASIDLRQLSDAAVRAGIGADTFARACTADAWDASVLPQGMLPPDAVWPCLVQYPEVIDEALGMSGQAQGHGVNLGHTLDAIDTFPAIPGRWLARLIEIALGETRAFRMEAQQLLGKVPGIGRRVAEALGSTKVDVRIEAARWLARLGDRTVVPALYAALDKENRETASATFMTALEKLGEDVAPRLAPERLLQEARKGLKAKPPAGMAWLTADMPPACAWADGTPVAPEIIHWWIILSAKLKEPAANALLVRYAGLLDAASRVALGRFVLAQFIARDTGKPTLEEATAWAQQRAAQYTGFASQSPAQQREEIEWWTRQRLAEYNGSAIGEKGMLALAFAVPGHELAETIRVFMRDHHLRRAQIEALLEVASVSDDPAAIQFVLATARRHRTASVKEKARLLVDVIAERNGWTQDQLADRTVPTGGLDETGRMTFQYGSREFSVVLDEKLKPVLHNADGKAIAALPEPRKDDPEDAIKEGKQLFTACKKEVKQVVEQQGARLYEAMCAGRVWTFDEWDEYVRRHPVVGRLAQRLAWMRLGDDGAVPGVFRPTEDGSLIDADDEEVPLASGARVKLAHAALLDDATVKAWLAHFKDYKVTPLFQQLKHRAPALPDPQATEIADRLGWMGETYPLRGAFTKLGYQRAAAEEGAFFDEYTKEFPGAGLRVRITFTGNVMPEENRPAALKTLAFARLAPRRGAGRAGSVPLGEVPPALLAEAYGDYLTVAATCQGFDPEWEKKAGW